MSSLKGSDDEVFPKRDVKDRPTTLHMAAFGQTFNLPLKPSQNLLSPYAEVVDTFKDPETGKLSKRKLSIVADPDEYPKQVYFYFHKTIGIWTALISKSSIIYF